MIEIEMCEQNSKKLKFYEILQIHVDRHVWSRKWSHISLGLRIDQNGAPSCGFGGTKLIPERS
jgi:hypothetical protein